MKICSLEKKFQTLTVFFSRDIGDMFNPAIIAMRELKLPMLKHSLAVSIQYSITRTRCFFLTCCKNKELKKYIDLSSREKKIEIRKREPY